MNIIKILNDNDIYITRRNVIGSSVCRKIRIQADEEMNDFIEIPIIYDDSEEDFIDKYIKATNEFISKRFIQGEFEIHSNKIDKVKQRLKNVNLMIKEMM